VIDYVTKYCLAATVTTTCRGVDALRCLDLAVAEAQRLLNLTDLRADRGVMDIIDAAGVIIGQAPGTDRPGLRQRIVLPRQNVQGPVRR